MISHNNDNYMDHNPNDDINLNTEAAPVKEKSGSPMLMLMEILVTGTAGWKQLRRSRLTPEQTAAGCFYPVLALASACRFADWFYLPEFILSETLIRAFSLFISFFFSYFAVQVVCRWLFPLAAKAKTETPYFKLVVQNALASLALFLIPAELVPILEPITVFLPIWTAFIITKGTRFLRMPKEHENRCMVTIVVTTIIMPYLIMWLCEKLI